MLRGFELFEHPIDRINCDSHSSEVIVPVANLNRWSAKSSSKSIHFQFFAVINHFFNCKKFYWMPQNFSWLISAEKSKLRHKKFSWILKNLRWKVFGWVSKTAFYVSRVNFWNPLVCLRWFISFQTLSDLEQNSFSSFGENNFAWLNERHSTLPEEHFERRNFSENKILLAVFEDFDRKNFGILPKKLRQCHQNCIQGVQSNFLSRMFLEKLTLNYFWTLRKENLRI